MSLYNEDVFCNISMYITLVLYTHTAVQKQMEYWTSPLFVNVILRVTEALIKAVQNMLPRGYRIWDGNNGNYHCSILFWNVHVAVIINEYKGCSARRLIGHLTNTSHKHTGRRTIEASVTLIHWSGDHRMNDLQFAGRYQCLPIRCSVRLISLHKEHSKTIRGLLLKSYREWEQFHS
jgi:hypothetical protein